MKRRKSIGLYKSTYGIMRISAFYKLWPTRPPPSRRYASRARLHHHKRGITPSRAVRRPRAAMRHERGYFITGTATAPRRNYARPCLGDALAPPRLRRSSVARPPPAALPAVA